MHSIEKLFIDIHKFLIDYVKVLQIINENSIGKNTNILTIKLSDEAFLLPATFNNFSQRTDELKNCLQRQIRILAQKRRKNILKGIDIDEQTDQQIESYKFNTDFKIRLEQLQNKISDKNMRKIIRYIQVIMDSFELYNDILTKRDFLNVTFRLLPVLQNIQKQVEKARDAPLLPW
jgi:flagellar biogenesis protein FliO